MSEVVSLQVDEWGRLVLEGPDGSRQVGVEPIRAFPISDPERWISFVNAEGREVHCLESLDQLAPDQRSIVREELALREFLPLILSIDRVIGEGLPADWRVVTDRGPTEFTVENEDDVRRIGPNRVLITDSRKLRYHVPDTRQLDHASRRLLERFL